MRMKKPIRNSLSFLALLLVGVLVACQTTPATPAPTATPNPGTPGPGNPDPGTPLKIPQPPAISSFTATPDELPAGGGDTKLQWSVTGATKLSIEGIGEVAGSSKTVNVKATKTFLLTAENADGSVKSTVDVTVNTPGFTDGLKPGTWDASKWNEAKWQ
jgi:hypothetical protein